MLILAAPHRTWGPYSTARQSSALIKRAAKGYRGMSINAGGCVICRTQDEAGAFIGDGERTYATEETALADLAPEVTLPKGHRLVVSAYRSD